MPVTVSLLPPGIGRLNAGGGNSAARNSNGLMDAALKDNIGLKVAAARLRQAQALVRVEGARLLPFLDAAAGLETGRFSENGFNVALRGEDFVSAFITPLSLRYQFDFWGKNRAAAGSVRWARRPQKKRNRPKSCFS